MGFKVSDISNSLCMWQTDICSWQWSYGDSHRCGPLLQKHRKLGVGWGGCEEMSELQGDLGSVAIVVYYSDYWLILVEFFSIIKKKFIKWFWCISFLFLVQGGLKLLDSIDPSASAFWTAGFIGIGHSAWFQFLWKRIINMQIILIRYSSGLHCRTCYCFSNAILGTSYLFLLPRSNKKLQICYLAKKQEKLNFVIEGSPCFTLTQSCHHLIDIGCLLL